MLPNVVDNNTSRFTCQCVNALADASSDASPAQMSSEVLHSPIASTWSFKLHCQHFGLSLGVVNLRTAPFLRTRAWLQRLKCRLLDCGFSREWCLNAVHSGTRSQFAERTGIRSAALLTPSESPSSMTRPPKLNPRYTLHGTQRMSLSFV